MGELWAGWERETGVLEEEWGSQSRRRRPAPFSPEASAGASLWTGESQLWFRSPGLRENGFHRRNTQRPPGAQDPALPSTDLEDVIGTLPAEVVLTRQDDHRLGKHLQADRTDQLLLQVLHGVPILDQA